MQETFLNKTVKDVPRHFVKDVPGLDTKLGRGTLLTLFDLRGWNCYSVTGDDLILIRKDLATAGVD